MGNKQELKIYLIEENEEKHWVSAYNVEGATKQVEEFKDFLDIDIDNIMPKEVSKSKWKDHNINNTEYNPKVPGMDWEAMTFEEFMKENTTPCFFCSSTFE